MDFVPRRREMNGVSTMEPRTTGRGRGLAFSAAGTDGANRNEAQTSPGGRNGNGAISEAMPAADVAALVRTLRPRNGVVVEYGPFKLYEVVAKADPPSSVRLQSGHTIAEDDNGNWVCEDERRRKFFLHRLSMR